ncbi:MAG: hypothetical protein ACK2T0_12145, partial [Anaerolineales bacterium]
MDGFYAKLRAQENTLAPPPDAPSDLDQYDMEEVQREFVNKLPNGG